MHYYLEDLASGAILLITPDLFLINNIKSGILDCHRHSLSSEYVPTINQISQHNKLTTNSTGIRFTPTGLFEFSLDEFPEAKQKQYLVKIRLPAFKLLLESANSARSNNRYGFAPGDDLYIKEALNNPTALADYARINNIDVDFAKEELSMIVESIFIDNFRIFSVCNMWKERINKCTTEDEISKILTAIKDTFWMAGIPNV